MRYVKRIAMDGPAGSGKSTIGTRLAERLGYIFVDAGMFYRAITSGVLHHQINPYNAQAAARVACHLQVYVEPGHLHLSLDGARMDALSSPEINLVVPIVAAHPEVRAAVRQIQTQIAQIDGVIFAGRDIGTVVMPHADLKLYLDVSLEERARRRHQATAGLTYQQVLADLQHRDYLDTHRHESPLRIAPDAIRINTDGMDIETVLSTVLRYAVSAVA